MITKIKNDDQYNDYAQFLWLLISTDLVNSNPVVADMAQLLTVLLKEYDEREPLEVREFDPVDLITSIMEDHNLSVGKLCIRLDFMDQNHIHRVIMYEERPSLKFAQRFADEFKLQLTALTKPYRLDGENRLDVEG